MLAWLYNRTGGSVLLAALAHGTYNLVAATTAAEGAVGTVVTIAIMLGAALVARGRAPASDVAGWLCRATARPTG